MPAGALGSSSACQDRDHGALCFLLSMADVAAVASPFLPGHKRLRAWLWECCSLGKPEARSSERWGLPFAPCPPVPAQGSPSVSEHRKCNTKQRGNGETVSSGPWQNHGDGIVCSCPSARSLGSVCVCSSCVHACHTCVHPYEAVSQAELDTLWLLGDVPHGRATSLPVPCRVTGLKG